MEVVGLTASILTLVATAHGVSRGVQHALELYEAPKEIIALQEQLDLFSTVLQAAKTASQHASPDEVLVRAVSRAQVVMQNLEQIVTIKLVKGGDRPRGRRRAWLRYRTKVSGLLEKLKEARDNISLALNTHVLASLDRVETSTEGLTRGLADLQSTIHAYQASQPSGFILDATSAHVSSTLVDEPCTKASLGSTHRELLAVAGGKPECENVVSFAPHEVLEA